MQYPNIAQPQYAFAPTMMNFKEGGLASLAQEVQAAGRNGDTMLAHITPEEAGILQLLGGSGTINPETGLPEFFLKKLFNNVIVKPVKQVYKAVESGVEGIAKALGPVGQIAAAYFGGPIGAAVYAGMAPEGGKFDFKRAALAGGLTYAGTGTLKPSFDYSSAFGGEAAAAAPIDVATTQTAAEAAAGTPSVVESVSAPATTGGYDFGAGDIGYTPPPAAAAAPPPPPPPVPSGIESLGVDEMAVPGVSGDVIAQGPGQAPISPIRTGTPGVGANAADPTLASGIGSLAEAGVELAADNPMTTAKLAYTGYTALEAKKELEAQKAEAERILAEQEKYTADEIAFAKDVLRRYPVEYRRLSGEDVAAMGMAAGGLAGLNAFKAGGQPRFLKGGGDGMSDDIPATIGGRQKAALSDGEFVIPADVVSHLGNGSSRAGAKKLYSMMDNIRKARTGRERQAPEVKADRYMPA